MAVDRKLLEQARRNPEALGFEDAVRLCRQLGFEKVRQTRVHRIFRHPRHLLRPFNLQLGPTGRAKAYQVEQMLELDPPRPPAALGRQASIRSALSYHVSWSEKDDECVATCEEIDGLSGLAPTPERAIAQLKAAVAAWRDYLAARGPAPSAGPRP